MLQRQISFSAIMETDASSSMSSLQGSPLKFGLSAAASVKKEKSINASRVARKHKKQLSR